VTQIVGDSPGRRAAAYWFADGFPDIVLGGNLGLSAAAAVLWYIYSPPLARNGYVVIVLGGFLLYLWKERRILELLKSRFTYPRTGYAQPPQEVDKDCGNRLTMLSLGPKRPEKQNVTLFRRRTVMTVFWFFYVLWNPSGRWQAPIMMLALAIALYLVNHNSEHPYSWRSVLLLALLGSVVLLPGIPVHLTPLISLLLTGLWFATQGLATLVTYLHHNPRTPRDLPA
jgi:hypothetical protein